jgi:cell division protease FtsH
MGGMVAEEIFFGEASTGPAGDLAGATRLAAQMVGSYGMAGSLVSLEALRGEPGIVTKVLADTAYRQSVEKLLEAAKANAREVLASQKHVVVALCSALLQRDELVGDEITNVIAQAIDKGTSIVPDNHKTVVDIRPGAVTAPN